ncbi:unnamed protein product [Cyprideis torosa]|uniref:Uncharacterized protein n=1 Tax=Cyprideis torosa TaxID=163714 RepID=A0A7R8WHR9_9CRUS|nr:unnamed protein product [Cyprideis torosa]CAG0897850.1 unnamed protein product [Cyprideis torosa]
MAVAMNEYSEEQLESDVGQVYSIVPHRCKDEIRDKLVLLHFEGVEDKISQAVNCFISLDDIYGAGASKVPSEKKIDHSNSKDSQKSGFAGPGACGDNSSLTRSSRFIEPKNFDTQEAPLDGEFNRLLDMFPDCHVGWLIKSVSGQGSRKVQLCDLISDMLENGYPKTNEDLEGLSKGLFESIEGEAPKYHKFRSLSVSLVPNMKKVMKEYKMLQNDLPGGIIVKSFTTNMDLLSAMIVGPKGTLYEDAVFFFDIVLPSGYPSVPPKTVGAPPAIFANEVKKHFSETGEQTMQRIFSWLNPQTKTEFNLPKPLKSEQQITTRLQQLEIALKQLKYKS